LPENAILDKNLVPPTAAATASSSTNPSAPSNSSDPKFSRCECSDDDDSDDDVPLSELRMSSDDQHVSLKRPRPLSPSVPGEEPILSRRRTASYCIRYFFPLMIDAAQSSLFKPKILFHLRLHRLLRLRLTVRHPRLKRCHAFAMCLVDF
jgi:hypothetical protein